MSWLRIDDGFDHHPKILALGSDQRRWTWMRVLVYTCRRDSPVVPPDISAVIPKATRKFIGDCVELGLVDVADDGTMAVHDWTLYNAATIGEKVAAVLARDPDASANEVQRQIGGKRELVLALVHQYRDGSQTVPNPVPGNPLTGSQPGSGEPPLPGSLEPLGNHPNRFPSGSRAGSHAREPHPIEELTPHPPPELQDVEAGGREIELGKVLREMPR